MLRLWFNTRTFFNQLLRACFKIMTCFNKSVILLEQGADWYLRPKNWWELIINSSERTSLSSTSPQHSHQQIATSQQLSDNGLTYRCSDCVQPNSNMEVVTHASNHPTQPTQQTQQPPCENSMSIFQGTQLGGQLNVLDQESTTNPWTMSPSLHNSTSTYFSDLTCLPQIPQQLWTLPQQRWQQQIWAHHSAFSLLLLDYRQQIRKGDQATTVYLTSGNTTWRNHMIKSCSVHTKKPQATNVYPTSGNITWRNHMAKTSCFKTNNIHRRAHLCTLVPDGEKRHIYLPTIEWWKVTTLA